MRRRLSCGLPLVYNSFNTPGWGHGLSGDVEQHYRAFGIRQSPYGTPRIQRTRE